MPNYLLFFWYLIGFAYAGIKVAKVKNYPLRSRENSNNSKIDDQISGKLNRRAVVQRRQVGEAVCFNTCVRRCLACVVAGEGKH
ncbi:hypothetical protein [Desulforhopalus sp. 52FAK]